jgi:hypothetical protein
MILKTDPEQQARRYTKAAIVFGVAMATLQMGVLLYFMYC